MSHLLPRFHSRQQAREIQQSVDRAVQDSVDVTVVTVARATLPGDNRRLRGIPCVARGVAGASPGTNPLAALLRSVYDTR